MAILQFAFLVDRQRFPAMVFLVAAAWGLSQGSGCGRSQDQPTAKALPPQSQEAAAGASDWEKAVARQDQEKPPPLRNGRETTYLVEPLLPDGAPDYVTYLNREWSQGVTPENNAAIPLLEALGSGLLPVTTQEKFFELLGVPAPQTNVTPFVNRKKYLVQKGINEVDIQSLGHTTSTAFKAEQYPILAQWVQESEAALEKVVSASQRDRYFTPFVIVDSNRSILMNPMPEIEGIRDLTFALSTRAMLRLGSGDLDGACGDVLAIQRLGRRISQSPLLIVHVVGIAIHGMGGKAAEQILLSGQLTAAQATSFRTELLKVPSPPDLGRCMNDGERLINLEAFLKESTLRSESSMLAELHRHADLNVACEILNREFDQIVKGLALSPFSDRARFIGEWVAKQKVAAAELHKDADLMHLSLTASPQVVGEFLGNYWRSEFLPSIEAAQEAHDRTRVRQSLLVSAAAIVEFQTRTGTLPEKLEELVPNYLEELPEDLFVEAPFRYLRDGQQFVLYSVGKNQRDDRGVENKDADAGDADDYRVGRVLKRSN